MKANDNVTKFKQKNNKIERIFILMLNKYFNLNIVPCVSEDDKFLKYVYYGEKTPESTDEEEDFVSAWVLCQWRVRAGGGAEGGVRHGNVSRGINCGRTCTVGLISTACYIYRSAASVGSDSRGRIACRVDIQVSRIHCSAAGGHKTA